MGFVAAGATYGSEGDTGGADGAFVDGVAGMWGEETAVFCLAGGFHHDQIGKGKFQRIYLFHGRSSSGIKQQLVDLEILRVMGRRKNSV